MFSSNGPTKLDLALYYAKVGDWILTEIVDRPLSLVRCPTGDVKDNFYQRHRMPGMPDGVQSISLREEGGKRRSEFIYLKDGKSLLGMAQFGAVEFHPWGCRVDKPERPDRLIFDLDPDESLDWRQSVDAAFQLRDALLELNLRPFLKTSSGLGS